MSREGRDWIVEGRLIQGFDYENQAWVQSGFYLDCGHKKELDYGCYGRAHKGEATVAPTPQDDECGLCEGKGWVQFGSGSTPCECQYEKGSA